MDGQSEAAEEAKLKDKMHEQVTIADGPYRSGGDKIVE